MDPSKAKELKDSASAALDRSLDEEQIQALVSLHENYLAYKDSSEPYVSDHRLLSNEDHYRFYQKLRKRAQKLLDALQDREGDLQKASVYRKFLGEVVFVNVIKEVKWVFRFSDREIKMMDIRKDPEKLADWLESGKVRLVPPAEGLPPEILNRIRRRKRRKGGPIPNSLLHSYIKNMAAWYEGVMGRGPRPTNTEFLDLVNRCWNLFDDQTIGEKMIRNALRNQP